MQVKIYKPTADKQSLGKLISEMFSDARSARDLAWRLTVRDFKGQYRQSILGVFWAFITPIMNTIVWIFLNKSGAVQLADTGIPYPVYVFTGTMLWAVLIESITMPLQQTNASKGIMSKINFPKEALLMSGIYKIFFNTLIKVTILFVALLAMGVLPTMQLLFLPVAFAGMVLFGFTVGMLITPVGMLYTDIGRAIPMLMQFLMYLSPVVYTVSGDSMLAQIVHINPLTALITTGRSALTGLPFEYLNQFTIISGIMLVLFFMGWFFYRFSIPIIVERNG
jgi:lipopolysaccharide transport system permease protein